MTTPCRPHLFSPWHALGSFALVAAFTLSFAWAADAPTPAAGPVPSIFIVSVEKGTTSPQNTSSETETPATSSTTYANQGDGRVPIASSSSTVTTKSLSGKGQTTYVITLRNGSSFPAKGIVVVYHFYNCTTVSSNAQSASPVISEITATTPAVDIGPGKNVTVETKPVPYENTQVSTVTTTANGYTSTNNSNGDYTVTPSSVISKTGYTAKDTTLLGWQVEVHYDGKIVGRVSARPDNLADLLKNYHYTPKP